MGTRSLYTVPIILWSLLTLLVHMLICLGTNGFSLKLIPQYSIDSVIFPKNLSQHEKHNRMVELSKDLALHFQPMNFTNATKQGIKALEPKIVYHPRNFYVAQMDIGTTPYSALLVVDTGSETTWVQGEGCTSCFPLCVGNFKYKESRSISPVSCDDPLCFPRICEDNICVYEINYKDHSHSRGYLSSDTFTFPAHGGERVSYENVVFGVGLDNQNIAFSKFRESENTIAGVLHLGHGYQSILWQLEAETDLRFSYCLSYWTNTQDTHTYLHFGKDAQIRGTNQEIVQTTPLIPNVNMYYVEVLSISMEGKKLPIDPVEFQLRSDFKGGFAIDTGSALTYLVQNAYNIVRVEIVKYLCIQPKITGILRCIQSYLMTFAMMSSQPKIKNFHH